MTNKKPKTNRGKVVKITLRKAITFNGVLIKKAAIEIDHINRGLDSIGNLKKKKRSDFSVSDLEKFIMLLDAEVVTPVDSSKYGQKFVVRIDSPITGKYLGREYIMVFTKNKKKSDEIYTVTLYLGQAK